MGLTETGFRVLDTLSRSLGTDLPISVLRAGVEERFGTAHYKNVHEAVTRLKDAGFLAVIESGNNKSVSLNLSRLETIDLLAEVDLRSRREALEVSRRPPSPTGPVAEVLHETPYAGTAFLVDAETNLDLNRLELVAIVHPSEDMEEQSSRLVGLHDRLMQASRRTNVRLDPLVLTEKEFLQAMASRDLHPLQAQAERRSALVDPQRFWWLIRNGHLQGLDPQMRPNPDGPGGTVDTIAALAAGPGELAPHLHRYGYTEVGTDREPVETACLEIVATAALASEEPRHRYASAVLLAKNQANPRLLAFLVRKHDVADELLGMIHGLQTSRTDVPDVGPFLPEETEPAEVDQGQIEEMLDLYNAR